jgi:Cytochrome c oxidase subunit IV
MSDSDPSFHLPQPSQWPAVLALGLMFAAFGILTSWAFSAVGVLISIWSIVGWMRELHDEPHHD